MTQDQEIKAKALEIAILSIGPSPQLWKDLDSNKPIEYMFKPYLDLAVLIEQHIRKS